MISDNSAERGYLNNKVRPKLSPLLLERCLDSEGFSFMTYVFLFLNHRLVLRRVYLTYTYSSFAGGLHGGVDVKWY